MVRIADLVSRGVITLGGLGTIVAVFTVCVFLVYVAVPLFYGAEIEDVVDMPQVGEAIHEQPVFVRMNYHKTLAYEIFEGGRVVVFDPGTREVLSTHDLTEGRTLTSSFFPRVGDHFALGFDDGTIQLGTLIFEVQFVPDENEAPEILALGLEQGERQQVGDQVIERASTGFRHHRLLVDLEAVIPAESPHPVLAIDLTIRDRSPIYVALSGDGVLRYRRVTRTQNLLTMQWTVRARGAEVPYPFDAEDPPKQVRVSGLGDMVLALWPDGRLVRFDMRDLRNIRVAEELDVTPDPGATVTAANFLIGRNSLLVGDSLGQIRSWFRITLPHVALTTDGLNLVRADLLSEVVAGEPLDRRLPVPAAEQMPHPLDLPRELADWGPERFRVVPTSDHALLVAAIGLPGHPDRSPVTDLAESSRGRLVAAGFEDGSTRVYQVTAGQLLVETPPREGTPIRTLTLAPKDDGLLASTDQSLHYWTIDLRHASASFRTIFQPIWYEGYSRPSLVWQSSAGTDDFESKYSLMPLIFGTLKATVYAMAFSLPLALMAAIYTSQFLHPRVKAWVKPLIEVMASLPSVVLGFLAALVFAPIIERIVPATLALLFVLPLTFLAAAYLWQLLPYSMVLRLEQIGAVPGPRGFRGRAAKTLSVLGGVRLTAAILLVFVGFRMALMVGPVLERLLFAGDLKGWLDGQIVSAAGGWFILLLPLCAIAVGIATALWVTPRLRDRTAGWPRRRMALLDLVKFLGVSVGTVALALVLSQAVDWIGLDPRGEALFPPDVFSTYSQRNAMVVGMAMAVAVIPIIYTIAEDALSAVPEHLRAASLGAGATPWQTAIRIVIPTAMSGMFSAVMIGLGRAVGETMIVLMAAGNTPVMEWNLFSGFRTLSANIAVELPEAPVGGTHYRILFLAALSLFVMTFAVNTVAETIRQRFRKRAFQL